MKYRKNWIWRFFKGSREWDYSDFKIKEKFCPNSLPNFIDSKRSDYLDYASKDIVWVLVSAIGNKYVSSDRASLEQLDHELRSWNQLQCKNSQSYFRILKRCSITTQRQRMEMAHGQFVKRSGTIGLRLFILHADEAVYSKVMINEWLYDKYSRF